MKYTVAIRTLGRAGEKYKRLLASLEAQSIPPQAIIVYIAEGYPLPQETIGKEVYVYVKKGMVAQRALPYNEVKTEYILFLDDDLFLPEHIVETMFLRLEEYQADVISPDIFPNAERSFTSELFMSLSGRMRARRGDDKWGYKVMRTAGYSYNARTVKEVYLSQTNAGACFLCTKANFLAIRFDEELWMDKQMYTIGDDQVMFYKMYKSGLKQLTLFHSGIEHLDAGTTMQTLDKEKNLIYSDFRYKVIFWHRFIFLPEKNLFLKGWACMAIGYTLSFTLLVSSLKGRWDILKIKKTGNSRCRSIFKKQGISSTSPHKIEKRWKRILYLLFLLSITG